MTDVLQSMTLAVRTDPFEGSTPQTLAPWAEVLAFLHHLEGLAGAGTAFQLVETPGQVACVVAGAAAAAPAQETKAPRARRTVAKT